MILSSVSGIDTKTRQIALLEIIHAWFILNLALYPVVVITKSGVNTGCSLFTRPHTKRGESYQFIIVNKRSARITLKYYWISLVNALWSSMSIFNLIAYTTIISWFSYITSSFYASTTKTDHSSLNKTIKTLITFILIHNWKLNNLQNIAASTLIGSFTPTSCCYYLTNRWVICGQGNGFDILVYMEK